MLVWEILRNPEVLILVSKKKVRLGSDGYFHDVIDCETILEMHERLKKEDEEVEE